MAAAGIVSVLGGTPRQTLDAAAITLKNVMGLVCDPIAGLVESPCQKRNALGAANALLSAEIVLAGIPSIIPFDEIVDAMYKVGRRIPMELRETALGGIAKTPTACAICSRVYG
jgi:L-serine dehydratase